MCIPYKEDLGNNPHVETYSGRLDIFNDSFVRQKVLDDTKIVHNFFFN